MAKNKIVKSDDGITLGLEKQLEYNNIYVDFNSIIYTIVSEIELDLNYLLYDIIDGDGIDEKSELVATKWGFDLEKTVENYKSFFTEAVIDEYAANGIKEYMINMFSVLINPKKIKNIMIAFDGIPTMSKIIEQKKDVIWVM